VGILPQNRRKPEFNTALGLDKHFVVVWKGNFLLGKIGHSRQFGQGQYIEVI
jgi:hypothetical protein